MSALVIPEVVKSCHQSDSHTVELWLWELGEEVPRPFPICPLNVLYSEAVPVCFL